MVDDPMDNVFERKDVTGFEPIPHPPRDIQNGKAITTVVLSKRRPLRDGFDTKR
jgi:hypothetical protein